MLQAHSYWRMHGLEADLVILNEEAGGYEQPLREQLEALIQAHATNTGTEQTGRDLHAQHGPDPGGGPGPPHGRGKRGARCGPRHPSPADGRCRPKFPRQPEFLARKRAPRDPSASLPFMELPYFNSLGGFTPDGREYAIYLGPDTHTPAPWVNVIANPRFGTLVSETGVGLHLVSATASATG